MSNESKITETPWRVGDDPEGEPDCLSIWTGDDGTEAELAGRIMEPANAAVMAAAPDLLKALEGLLEVCSCSNGCAPDDETCATAVARMAIAKAKELP
jgi:hypothetical protein